jgi:biotin operon repressor
MNIEANEPIDVADRMARVLKALAEPSRLRILGLLVEGPRTGEELAQALGLGAPTISHHMRCLTDAGLVTATPEQYYQVYRIRPGALAQAARLLDEASLAEAATDVRGDDFEVKVVRDFFEDGRLIAIPRQRKKRLVVLEHLAGLFEPGRTYTEAEVNEALGRAHEDVATLRREMIGYGLLARAMGEYWRV